MNSWAAVFVLSALWPRALSVTRYSIEEEMERGSVVANLAADLGLEPGGLAQREVKLDIFHNKKYLDVNKNTGELFIVEKMDREYLCPIKTTSCFLKLDVVIESPLRIFNIELGITDINDNAPHFRRDRVELDVSESATPGERFSLPNAVDPDVGTNTIKSYKLSASEHFTIETQTGSDGTQYVDLVLTKSLDREETAVHNLILTAVDGGVPVRSGTANIIVRVQDTNDNPPRFDKQTYTINMTENSPIGTLVMKLNATDLDEGLNSEIVYSFTLYTSEKTQDVFALNLNTGEITIKGTIDYEDMKFYELHIEARDKGTHPLLGQCKVVVHVTDMNDNYPEITIQSVKNTVDENIPVGSVIALVGISDRDTGVNGNVSLSINQPMPFILNKSSDRPMHYKLIVSEPLDRETIPEYDITLIVTDAGTPPLSDNETITVHLLDVNDNAPQFPQSFYTIRVMENNAPGALLSSLTAFDPDLHENQYLLSTMETAVKAYSDMTEVPLEYDIFSDLNLYLVIGLGSVSFLLLITILVTIVLKCQKPKPSKAAPPCRNSVISERNSTIADSTLVSNDAYWYSLFLAETRKGKLVVRQPVPKGSRYIVSSIPRGTGLTDTSDSAPSTLQVPRTLNTHTTMRTPVTMQGYRRYVALIVTVIRDTFASVTHYSIPEEMKEGSVVANLATDLGLDVKTLNQRKMRLDIIANKKYLDVNKETGELYIVEKIDREYLCPSKSSASCYLKLEIILENPVRIFNIEVEILDMNDNAPQFRRDVIHLDISEATPKGERFSLSNAVDPDVGSNSVKTYHLMSEPLDREKVPEYDVTFTVTDRGSPPLSDNETMTLELLDVNDNVPQFPQTFYTIRVMENNAPGALLSSLTAFDPDLHENQYLLSTMETAVKAYSDMTEVPLEYDIFSDLNLYLVIGLGSVSFLLLITILVTIVLKCQKPKPSKAAPPCRNSVISERNSTIADSTLVSNDAYWYSLFLAETRKGKLVVRQPVPKGSRYIVSSIPRGTGLTDTSDSAPSTLQV
ncbi:hypothetical protein ABVT39_016666 [Epinephelus coioides]